jgi:hypothetical protein
VIEFVSPHEYFRKQLKLAAHRLGMKLDERVEFYLVALLCHHVGRSSLATLQGEIDLFTTPLAFMLKQALEAPPADKVKIYKGMGDTALFLAGYFKNYLQKKMVDRRYYISMGSTAYESLSSLMKSLHRDDDFGAMFHELARDFADLVLLVEGVAETEKSSLLQGATRYDICS